MIVARIPQPSIPVLSLRAKISHSWLDHEVAMVSDELAVERWQSGLWIPIAERWETLHQLAEAFGDALDEFSSATLVDILPALKELPEVEKVDLKEKLSLLHVGLVDTPALRLEYGRYLGDFWRTAQAFFNHTHDPKAANESVSHGWKNVRNAAAELKQMFESGRIPDGIVLP